ncbi:MAG: MCE family protein [Cytophagales bacterium]|nr:MAG: MCE family protein [Cytophagales bacterium]
MSIHKEVKVAIFVIIAGTMLYMGFNFLKGVDFLSSTKRYYATYPDVQGLTVSNPVIVNGLTVGRVSNIEFLDDSAHALKVSIDVRKEVSLGDSSISVIANQGILGGKAIIIKVKNPSKPLPKESFLISEIEASMMDKLSVKTDPILNNFNTSLMKVNNLMSKNNTKTISSILVNLEQSTKALQLMISNNDKKIGLVMQNVQNLSASLVETEKMIKPILTKTSSFADSLNKMQLASAVNQTNLAISELNKSLKNINNGKGTAGKLIYDDSLYVHLDNSARDLDKLMIDMKANPKRYVHFSIFGRKDKSESK